MSNRIGGPWAIGNRHFWNPASSFLYPAKQQSSKSQDISLAPTFTGNANRLQLPGDKRLVMGFRPNDGWSLDTYTTHAGPFGVSTIGNPKSIHMRGAHLAQFIHNGEREREDFHQIVNESSQGLFIG